MSVERITPSPTYQQSELSRIQDNLARAIDSGSSASTQLLDAGSYSTTSYPGGIVTSNRIVYNATNGASTVAQSFIFPATVTILGVSMSLNASVAARTDFYIQANGKTLLTAQGVIQAGKTYGTLDGSIPIPANTPFNAAYGFSVAAVSVVCYSYLLIQIGS